MIVLKKPDQIEIMQSNGAIVVECFEFAREYIRPGRTRRELDAEIEKLILSRGGTPAFKGFHGYPASTCISVNEEVVHGIPDDRPFQAGDIVGLDIGVLRDDYYVDSARSIPVGKISAEAERLLEVTWDALEQGIQQARPGNRLTDISFAVEARARKSGFSVVRSLVGHGIGQRMHEDPQVPNFGPRGQGPVLEEGLVIAIEPMINVGTAEVFTLDDGWTIVTADRKLSAHFEDTVAVTKDGPRILTR
ncbi:MAG TPA: type I methionyl aminopeptidase [Candidatus Krumholzibacteria bacterium]|nr:type I methionyl aminopeptidase [Candidatus Krumholzibacteria bacterium]